MAGLVNAPAASSRPGSAKSSDAFGSFGRERGRRQGSLAVAELPVISTDAEVEVSSPATATYDDEFTQFGENFTWGQNVGGPTKQHRTSRLVTTSNNGAGTGPSGSSGMSSGDSSTGNEPVESIGTTLNRQASILMLLYPLAYCLLFSISIVRIITDLVSPPVTKSVQQDALHSVSRWFIFAQGALDAVIFQIIEKQFRKRMKRRRKKALGEKVEDTALQKASKAVSKIWTRRRGSERRDSGKSAEFQGGQSSRPEARMAASAPAAEEGILSQGT